MNRRVFAATLGVLLLTVPTHHSLQASAPGYTVEDLGTTVDGFVPTVTGMNAAGQVSGYVSRPEGFRAVRFTNGVGWTYVPGLESVYSVATAINASGDLTGYYMPAGLRAFRYVDGVGITTIPVLPGGTYGIGYAITANGDVVGYGNSAAGNRAWRASAGLPPLVPPVLSSTASTACGANETGQIVGSFTTAAGYQHAFRLELDGSLTDIGTLQGPSSSSSACAIDDADGRVGGHSSLGQTTHAFLFSTGAPTDIDAFGSSFSSVDAISSGVSVGTFTLLSGASQAFVRTDADGMSDLNGRIPAGSGWVLSGATAVNSKGQIAGQGLVAGVPRAFRLTPAAVLDTTPPVITSLTATPSRIWPPNDALVPVSVAVVATDDSGEAPSCALSAITASGAAPGDYSITGQYSALVRAVGGRTYSLRVTCSDAAGNRSSASVDVVVPPDTTPPTITALSASPSFVWPPNGKMVTVSVSVTATDDVDATPTCGLMSIAGPSAADAVITGVFTASVRARKEAAYILNVGCRDRAGNLAQGAVTVTVSKAEERPVRVQ